MTTVDVYAEWADVDVFLDRVATIDIAYGPAVTVDVSVAPVLLVDVEVDLPGAIPNRVVFGEFNYLWFGDQVIYGSN